MSETYMVMVLVPIMAPFTCIGARETRATQIWARVTMRAAVGNRERQILLRSISARRALGGLGTAAAACADGAAGATAASNGDRPGPGRIANGERETRPR
jgi:hypothetical protein